jgi:murein DD-endopeptidase MepM/ murein hydrolase activator NlpD
MLRAGPRATVPEAPVRLLRAAAVLLALFCAACAGRSGGPAPVIEPGPAAGRRTPPTPPATPGSVLVQSGDTLYAVARRVNQPIRALIDANGLVPPYRLVAGQSLRLPGPAAVATPPAAPAPVVAAAPAEAAPRRTGVEAAPAEARPSAPPPAPLPGPASPGRPGRFAWPVQGQVISAFGPKPGGLQNDGINIAAARGAPVRAAGHGVVVYAGNELRGFGNLLLVRHGDGWMSAYAHLDEMLVERGAEVQRGQQIGRVGQTGSVASPQLHFELRHDGRAVDPRGALPPGPSLAAN